MTKKSKKRFFLCGGIALLVLGLGVFLSEIYLPRMFVVPNRTGYNASKPADTPTRFGLEFKPFDTTTSDGLTLKGWFVPAVGQPATGTVIILHGWGGSKEWIREMIRLVVDHGHNAIAFDSRGHGASGGHYCTYGDKEKHDVSAVFDEARKRFRDVGPVGVLGISFGGAVATQALANDKRLQCGIIVSSFCRLEDVARAQMRILTRCDNDWLLHRALAKGEALAGFNVAGIQPTEAARSITQPVLVIHGEHDKLVPVGDAHRLFEHLASTNKEWYAAKNSDHDHILESADTAEINRRIVAFLARWMPPPR